MGILADIGRSNAGQIGNTVFDDVMKYKQMERQGDRDAMAVAAQAQQIDMQQRSLAIQEAEALRKKQEFDDLHTAEKLDDFRTKSESKGQGYAYKVLREHLDPYVRKDPSGNEFVLRKDRMAVAAKIAADPNARWQMGQAMIQGMQDQSDEYGTKFDALKKKLDENPDATLEEQKKWSADAQAMFGAKQKMDADIKLQYNRLLYSDKDLAKTLIGDARKEALAEKKLELDERKQDSRELADRNREDAMDRRLGIMERIAASKASGKELGFADKEAIRAMGKQLPKTKVAAETATKNLLKIDRMLSLIDKGAGGVRGELLAKINKAADVLRVTSPEDAKYNTLKAELRGFAGALRLQLGLIGQTSDRDVAIMYEAAGGNSPAESQKAILNGYRQGYLQDITTYNSDAEAYSGYSKAGSSLYKPIPIPTAGGGGVQVVETRKTKDGRTLEKLSDGTIREKK